MMICLVLAYAILTETNPFPNLKACRDFQDFSRGTFL